MYVSDVYMFLTITRACLHVRTSNMYSQRPYIPFSLSNPPKHYGLILDRNKMEFKKFLFFLNYGGYVLGAGFTGKSDL